MPVHRAGAPPTVPPPSTQPPKGPARVRRGEKKRADEYVPGGVRGVAPRTTSGATRVPHTWAEPLREVALETSGQLKQAGQLMHEGADALDFTDPHALEVHTLGTQASQLGDAVALQADASQLPAGKTASELDGLGKRAHGVLAKVLASAAHGRAVGKQGVEKIAAGAQKLDDAVRTYTVGVAKAVDYQQNIDLLGDRDSYRLGVFGFFGLAGVAASGGAEIEVSREGDKFVVAIDGEGAAGVWADVGVHVFGLGADAHGALMAGGGHRLELTVDSAEEAKHGVRALLSRFAAKVTRSELRPEHAELFKEKLSAVELRGHVALEAFAMMGIKSAVSGIVELEGKGEHVVRAELGEQPALVMTQRLSAELRAGIGLSPTLDAEGETMAVAMLGQLTGSAEVELENRYQLAGGVDRGEFVKHPLKALRALRKEERTDHDEVARFSFEGKGGPLGSGGGVAVELAVETDLSDLKSSGAVGKALRGDLHGAVQAMPVSSDIELKLERFADYGVSLAPGVYFMSFGGEVELEAMRKDVDFDSAKDSKTPVREVPSAIKGWLKSLVG